MGDGGEVVVGYGVIGASGVGGIRGMQKGTRETGDEERVGHAAWECGFRRMNLGMEDG